MIVFRPLVFFKNGSVLQLNDVHEKLRRQHKEWLEDVMHDKSRSFVWMDRKLINKKEVVYVDVVEVYIPDQKEESEAGDTDKTE